MNGQEIFMKLPNDYKKAMKIVVESTERTTQISESGVGGKIEFKDGSRVEFIPSHERGNRKHLVTSNTEWHLKNFLKKNGFYYHSKENDLDDMVKKYMQEIFTAY